MEGCLDGCVDEWMDAILRSVLASLPITAIAIIIDSIGRSFACMRFMCVGGRANAMTTIILEVRGIACVLAFVPTMHTINKNTTNKPL